MICSPDVTNEVAKSLPYSLSPTYPSHRQTVLPVGSRSRYTRAACAVRRYVSSAATTKTTVSDLHMDPTHRPVDQQDHASGDDLPPLSDYFSKILHCSLGFAHSYNDRLFSNRRWSAGDLQGHHYMHCAVLGPLHPGNVKF